MVPVEQIIATTLVLVRQTNRLHALVGNIQDLRFSNPTAAEVEEMRAEYLREREFACFALQEVDKITKAL